MEPYVFVEAKKTGVSHWKSAPFTTSDILLNAKAYDDDLGMKRYGEVFRQLQRDVPRCDVRIDGRPSADANTVYRKSPYPRMCTQAVFAPVLEWLMRNDVMASELPVRRTLQVEIDTNELTMSITKHFRLLATKHEVPVCTTMINIYVHSPSNRLVISNNPHTPPLPPCSIAHVSLQSGQHEPHTYHQSTNMPHCRAHTHHSVCTHHDRTESEVCIHSVPTPPRFLRDECLTHKS